MESDFRLFCSSQNPIFRLFFALKSTCIQAFQIIPDFFRLFVTDALTPLPLLIENRAFTKVKASRVNAARVLYCDVSLGGNHLHIQVSLTPQQSLPSTQGPGTT